MTNPRKLLNSYHANILLDMGSLLDIEPDSGKKADYVDALAPHLFQPGTIAKALALIGPREQQALGALQQAGGRAQANRLRVYLLRHGVIEPSASDNLGRGRLTDESVLTTKPRRTSFFQVAGRLMALGLVCGEGIVPVHGSTRSKIYYDNVATLYIPDQVLEHLPALPVPYTAEQQISGQLVVRESSARAFQRDLYFYWSTAHTTPLALTKEDRLYRRDLRLVNSALLNPEEIEDKDEPDCPRLLFLRRLLSVMGVIKENKRTLTGINHPPFLEQPPEERIDGSFKHWREGTFWNELLSVDNIQIVNFTSRLDPVPEAIARARQCVLKHMAELHRVGVKDHPEIPAQDRWVPIDHLSDSLRIADYGFLFPRDFRPSVSYYYTYYGYSSVRSPYISYGNEMGWSISPPFEDEAEGWEVVEVGFIREMLREPLFWMGLVDLGFAGDRLVAYRLTAAGEWMLGVGRQLEIPKGAGKVIVQPNFEIFALDPISDLTLSKLDDFADRINAERAIKYRLTRESVYRAQRRGWTSARVLSTLDEMSDTPLPQNVVRTLEEWQTIHERIKIHRRRSVLQAVDGELLDKLIAVPDIETHLVSRPDATVALVSSLPGELETLVHHLQANGYPPARSRSAADPPHPSLTIEENGHLGFTLDLPSIYLYQQIAPFTSQDEQGEHFITQSSVQEAIGMGMTAGEILAKLRALHLGPLPRWVEIKVRAWAQYYGKAAVQTITLVQIKDKGTLQELLAEPELAGLLAPFEPQKDKALAVVDADKLEALLEALAERNIQIKEELT